MKVYYAIEVKEGKKYTETFRCEDKEEVYETLSHLLISKKLNKCTWIKRIVNRNNYDGTITITIYYDNDTRSIYVVKE